MQLNFLEPYCGPTDLLRVFTRPPVKLFLEGIFRDALRLHELSISAQLHFSE